MNRLATLSGHADNLPNEPPPHRQSLMNLSKFIHSATLIILSSASCMAMADECHYRPLDPGTGKTTVGQAAIDLGEGDSVEKPTAWIGPMNITQSGGRSCAVDATVSIMERPFYTDGRHLLVSTYSGSNRIVYAIDVTTCAVLWKSDAFAGKVSLDGPLLHMAEHTKKLGPHCIP